MRPPDGNQCRYPEKRMIRSIPSQNTGIETPMRAEVIVRLSIMEFFFTAESTPKKIPMIAARIIAKTESSIVAGSLAKSSSATGVLVK